MIGNLLRTSKWVGFVLGMLAISRSGEGLSNGSRFFAGGASSLWGVGFFARDGQKRSWNYNIASEQIKCIEICVEAYWDARGGANDL
jgi:hypothetical protein